MVRNSNLPPAGDHCDLCHNEAPRGGYDDECCCCSVHMKHGGEFTGFTDKSVPRPPDALKDMDEWMP